MNIQEVLNALDEIRADMNDPERDVAISLITQDEIIFANGATYSLITKQRVQ